MDADKENTNHVNMKYGNPHGARWSKEFQFFNEAISQTEGKSPQVTKTVQVPSNAELMSMKPSAVGQLSNMTIQWRQWGVGMTRLQGSPFGEISLGLGKQQSAKDDVRMDGTDEHMFKKDITWQDREFDFNGE